MINNVLQTPNTNKLSFEGKRNIQRPQSTTQYIEQTPNEPKKKNKTLKVVLSILGAVTVVGILGVLAKKGKLGKTMKDFADKFFSTDKNGDNPMALLADTFLDFIA